MTKTGSLGAIVYLVSPDWLGIPKDVSGRRSLRHCFCYCCRWQAAFRLRQRNEMSQQTAETWFSHLKKEVAFKQQKFWLHF
jgi:hypothetical protein